MRKLFKGGNYSRAEYGNYSASVMNKHRARLVCKETKGKIKSKIGVHKYLPTSNLFNVHKITEGPAAKNAPVAEFQPPMKAES